MFMISVQSSSIVWVFICNRWVWLENRIIFHWFMFIITAHIFSADQEAVTAANFHSGWVPRWARGQTLGLQRKPGERQPHESLYPPSAKPLCEGWEGPTRVLDAVWWAVWAEDGLHPPRVQTGRSPRGSVAGSDAQDELRGSTCLLPRQPSEPSHH